MRETTKHDGTVSEKDLPKEKVGSDDVTRNNLEKETDMNLKIVKKEPVEVTETDTSSFEEVKELNITQEEADKIGQAKDEADTIRRFGKLNIKEEEDILFKTRGPTGGIPVNYPFNPMENKHIPVGPPLLPNYGNPQMYQQQPNYAAQQGRRMLDEPDQPPRKFIASPNFNPQQTRQMPQYDVNNLNQAHMPTLFNPSMTYQPNQMFGMAPQQEKINLRMKTNTSGGTVTVTSPEIPGLSNPFEDINCQRNQNFVDNLLEDWDTQDFPLTQNCGMPQMTQSMIQNSVPLANINQTGPIGHPTTQPHMPMTSQMQGSAPIPVSSNMVFNNFNQDFTSQSFRDPQNRRRSDPNDSGMESAGEASPYPESTPSPNGSTYTSPPSVDSGCGKSPGYGPFSPDSNSHGSVGGSPPKYTGMVTSPGMYSETASPGSSGYGSPGAPQVPTPMSIKTFTPSPDNLLYQEDNNNNLNGQGSTYIDQHKEALQDALSVIADNIRDDAQRKTNKKASHSQGGQQKRPVSSGAFTGSSDGFAVSSGGFQPATSQNNVKVLGNAAPVTSVVQAGPPATTTVTTIILPPQQPLIAPQHQHPLVLVPMMQPGQTGAPIFIPVVPPKGTQNTPPPKRAPRKILPKMPASMNSGTPNGTNTSQNPGSVAMPSSAQPAVKNTKTPSQQNLQAIKQQQQKTLNMARRNVADVKTENLIQVDEEGDTYLHIAVCRTDRFMIQALLERLKREGLTYLVDQENSKRQTPLFLAVAVNEPQKVQLLVNAGANVNTLAQNLSSDGQTTEVRAAIHVASVGGKESLKTLEELLKGDVNINIVNNYGQTALHCAILAHGKPKKNGGTVSSTDSRSIIQALIKKGADPSAQDKKSGKTPLMYSIEHRSIALVETILSAVEPSKMRNVVKTQAFDGSSCLKIAEGIKKDFNGHEFNRLWDILQGAVSGTISRIQPQVF